MDDQTPEKPASLIPEEPQVFRDKDAALVSNVLQKAVQTLKDTMGEDFFCDNVGMAIEINFERAQFPGQKTTQYMIMGSEEQYLNLACYLTYIVGVMRAKTPAEIEAYLKITAKEVKHKVMKYNNANPYQPEEDEPQA